MTDQSLTERAGRRLKRRVEQVVSNGNCSGCGACAALFDPIRMELNGDGFMRPAWESAGSGQIADSVKIFEAICPGVGIVAARPNGARHHPTMGPYVSVWTAWASDDKIRFSGSSGGVLTALSAWLLETGAVQSVVGASMSEDAPSRTIALELRDRSAVLEAAGSRYAPVSNAELFRPDDASSAFVGKPCEVCAARQMTAVRSSDDTGNAPVLLSFFCAGVPSQNATDELLVELGVEPEDALSVRYRGNGWPGEFTVASRSGAAASISYEDSWGTHLGRRLQNRCKICPDGTGGHADIAVGDFWTTGPSGYPAFDDAEGTSVAIARTTKGHEILMRARADGVVVLAPACLDDVAAIQPLQVNRRNMLLGRLAGRLLARKRIPRFRGFSMLNSALAAPRKTMRSMRGTYSRARRDV